jgi:hypothetical protein
MPRDIKQLFLKNGKNHPYKRARGKFKAQN